MLTDLLWSRRCSKGSDEAREEHCACEGGFYKSIESSASPWNEMGRGLICGYCIVIWAKVRAQAIHSSGDAAEWNVWDVVVKLLYIIWTISGCT